MTEYVYHPNHYNHKDKPECWTLMEDLFGYEATGIFDILNAFKYLYRAGSKENNTELQDLTKLSNYVNHAKFELEKSKSKNLSSLITIFEEYYNAQNSN